MMAKLTTLGMAASLATIILPTANTASADTVMIQQADPNDTARTRIRNGITVLRATDEEHTNEQATFAFDPVQKDVGVVVMMSTGRLNGIAGDNLGDEIQVGNIQGACMPVRIVKDAAATTGITLQPVVAEFKYVSQRQSDENRAYHHPEVEAIGGGRFAISANWDRNNNTNTERYMQVVDSNCNLITLTANVTLRENNTSAVIMKKNNDNCSGRQAGGGGSVHIYADGTAGIMSEELCNGNGRDDGWANYLTVKCAADGSTCDVQKQFDVSVIDQEERSRGRCEQMDMDGDGSPETSICCGTEGNGQPQREGVWCSAVDHETGTKLYKERIAYKGETASGQRTYAMRIKMLAAKDITGKNTGKVMFQYQMHRGNNNNNKKGGYDDKVMIVVGTPTRDGLNLGPIQDITSTVIASQVEMTHSTMFQTFTGTPTNPTPVFAFLTGNHNGTAGVNAKVMNLAMSANGVMSMHKPTGLAAPFDGQKYSKMLGDNPNNQGRNYTDCHMVPNPYIADDGATKGVPFFNMCAVTGKHTRKNNPAIKPDLVFEIWTSVKPDATPDPTEPGDPTDPTTPDPTTPDPTTPDPGTTNPTTSPTLGGCSTSNGSSSGALLLLGFALLGLRRRRQS